MYNMFNTCASLETLDVSKWNTSACTDMGNMFQLCSNIKRLDVSGWDTSACTNMSYMFNMCASLETLDVSNWDVSKVTTMFNMFNELCRLEKITLGEKFSFNVNGINTKSALLPTPSDTYIPNADGNWHRADGTSYAADDVPSFTAGTYYADSRAGEDYLVKGATLIDLGTSVRKKTNTSNRLMLNDMKDAIDIIGISATSDGDGNVILNVSGLQMFANNGNVTVS